jgi:hypothetical protein
MTFARLIWFLRNLPCAEHHLPILWLLDHSSRDPASELYRDEVSEVRERIRGGEGSLSRHLVHLLAHYSSQNIWPCEGDSAATGAQHSGSSFAAWLILVLTGNDRITRAS